MEILLSVLAIVLLTIAILNDNVKVRKVVLIIMCIIALLSLIYMIYLFF